MSESKNKKSKKTVGIIIAAAAVIAAVAVLAVTVIVPRVKYGEKYDAAMKLYNAQEYEKAVEAFEWLDYKDSKEMAKKSTEASRKLKYDTALKNAADGKYANAVALFKELGEYKDCAAQIEKCYIDAFGEEKYRELQSINVGDTYVFGAYEQDNNQANGKESIAWQVLAKEGASLLLVTKNAVENMAFDTTYEDVKWDASTIRAWLNDTFFNEAFSEEEQKLIPTKHHDNPPNPDYPDIPAGEETDDRVFLLSIEEINEYFADEEARICNASEYAYAKGAFKADNGHCWWWTRTPGGSTRLMAVVYSYGKTGLWGYAIGGGDGSVRPAIWIGLE